MLKWVIMLLPESIWILTMPWHLSAGIPWLRSILLRTIQIWCLRNTKSIEAGLEMTMFQSRVGFDVAAV